VCTDQGLLVAASGESLRSEIAAGLTSLFDDIVVRAQRDLGFPRVDELTLTDGDSNRYVIRPLPIEANLRLFLVVQVPVATQHQPADQAADRPAPPARRARRRGGRDRAPR
jgi:hypothetical protein